MAEAVIADARAALARTVFAPPAAEGPLEARIEAMLTGASQLYAAARQPMKGARFPGGKP